MIVYPAIDLKEGKAVRLLRGEMASATVFNEDPVAQAEAFREAGFTWLHVVDLDGAMQGKPVNREAVSGIIGTAGMPVQVGGGIRNMATIEAWLELGAARVILGTIAVKDPDLVKQACRRFRERVVVGIDARQGRVAVEGWAQESELEADDLARRFEDAGAAAIVYTDIERDGALEGVNVEATAALAEQISTPVIASGGVASLDDISRLLAIADKGVKGVIVGRALYDGRVDPAAAIALVRGGESGEDDAGAAAQC